MAGRRIIYLLTCLGCFVFVYFYQQWFAWLALAAILCLPLFSLLMSLPAMLTARVVMDAPERVPVGTPVEITLRCRSVLPTPLWRCKVLVERSITAEKWRTLDDTLPTEHCGQLVCTIKKAKVFDYLGLFSLPLRGQKQCGVLVQPKPVAMEDLPDLNRDLCCVWRPKWGGFAENHELRLYRPGDSVQQIHWKLSAKTGQLILREPMIPEPGRVLLRLDLKGTPQELDRMLGRLLWLGEQLLEMNISFEIQCMTGIGLESLTVTSPEEFQAALDTLLGKPCAGEGTVRDRIEPAAWICDIGGGPDDA